jgi:bifunctional non-homologous end joining protein LigD
MERFITGMVGRPPGPAQRFVHMAETSAGPVRTNGQGMALELYRKKRNFRTTPEPRGKAVRRRTRELSFVIQKHRASRLHYDFRLELDGVLLSWAVPKGPSLDPGVKRLAMHVEDHPIEYGEFEGVIPPKQYGSGTVLLWDRGTWKPREDPATGYRKGRLKFELKGRKLHGGWMLVRSRSRQYGNGDGDKAWLLFKEKDEHARPEDEASIVEDEPASVASGRTLEEIARDADRVWQSNQSVAANVKAGAIRRRKARARPPVDPSGTEGAREAPIPDFIRPQLATLVKQSPAGDNWLHEIKLDGYRMICRIERGKVRMVSRNGNEWTAKFPEIAKALARLPVQSAWIDGEVVVLQKNGVSSFQALQNALSGPHAANLHFYAFDLPYLDGYDLRQAPLVERKRLLEQLLAGAPAILHYSPHVQGQGREFYEQGCRLKLEGVIAKLADAPYSSGRGRSWVKVKCIQRQEMVIGGYTDPEGSRTGLGALLLGVYEPGGKLRYSGRVGTGFNEATLKDLRRRLGKLEQDTAPFHNPPRGWDAKGAHWVKPELVGEVAFTEWTNEGTLRHPSFQGLRLDKKPREVVREIPAAAPSDDARPGPARRAAAPRAPKKRGGRKAHGEDVEVGAVRLSNPDKALYPESGITKRDLADYYAAAAAWILPHLAQRPLSLVRCPNGWRKQCFFQKNADKSTSGALERVTVRTSEGPASYMMANSADALTALVQMGVLEIHPWGSTARSQGCPDRIIFDIDPGEGVEWPEVAQAAREVRTLLEGLGLQSFVKTTGGKGLHVVAPVQPRVGWDDVKGFSKAIADLFARTFPERFTSNMAKAKRGGKMFIDYLRNAEGATAVSAYSTRARANAPVAVPLAWKELGARDVRFDHFHIGNVPQRLARLKADPWEGFFDLRQSVTAKMMKEVGYKK